MKKIIMILIVVLGVGSLFFVFQKYNDRKNVFIVKGVETDQGFKDDYVSEPFKTRRFSNDDFFAEENIDDKRLEETLASHDIPMEVQAEILLAMREGDAVELDDDPILEEELKAENISNKNIKKASLSKKTDNLMLGFQLGDEAFSEILQATKPVDVDDDVIKSFKSEALLNAGFAVLSEGKMEQAEQAFLSVIHYYDDSDAAQIATFELALLKTAQGKSAEAIWMMDEIIAVSEEGSDVAVEAEKFKKTIGSFN